MKRLYPGPARAPRFSPDGSRIAFAGEVGLFHIELIVMDANGGNVAQLTPTDASWDHSPSWSPDGQRIAFASQLSGGWEIWTMNADGTNPLLVTRGQR